MLEYNGMKVRKNCLPAGWYPRDPVEISSFLAKFDSGSGEKGKIAIAPHAGWFYSGKIAAKAASSLIREIDTITVIGGHLPGNHPPLFAMEDAVETPLGNFSIDAELRNAVIGDIKGSDDIYRDNTVEVLLPMLRYFLPKASLLWMRFGADIKAYSAGIALANAAAKLGRRIAVLASADLTHYGPNYGFMPKGTGRQALQWVQQVNDRRLIEAVETGDAVAVLERAETEFSSCSAGALLGAMGAASVFCNASARLLEYGSSAGKETEIPDSFVGYAAMLWEG